MLAQNRIADVAEMGRGGVWQKEAVLRLAGVTQNRPLQHDDIFTHKRAVPEINNIETTIVALDRRFGAQRRALGDLVVDTALDLLRERLATLMQPDQAPDERKRVTVLFADVSGYTALSENLDPEDVAAIMNRLFEAVTVEIHRYGGSVDKYSGDAVMALFGAPQALENHEEMAVRASLAMQRVIGAFSEALAKERGFRVAMRIGLNTGPVLAGLVGGLKTRSYTVMGDTVNLASRLEHAAPVGPHSDQRRHRPAGAGHF
jgi:class 3 adenylate cyclase